MLVILITILHVFVSVFLILIVLTQQGKGQDLASAFGGTGSQTAFGARGTATLLSKITAGTACPIHGDLPQPELPPARGHRGDGHPGHPVSVPTGSGGNRLAKRPAPNPTTQMLLNQKTRPPKANHRTPNRVAPGRQNRQALSRSILQFPLYILIMARPEGHLPRAEVVELVDTCA